MSEIIQKKIMAAVDDRFDQEVNFLAELTSHPSLRGKEQSAQNLIESALVSRGYEVDKWQVNVEDIKNLPGFSPVLGSYEDALNVVGIHKSKTQKGKSLILNGHIDVVPEGPLDMWERNPYDAYVKDGWMYGRGAGDMKAGLVANLFALDALNSAGYQPAADVFFQSVCEE
ncbi:MAG: M20/M25/M40 family metallo-hydrolase, partial [Alphaproteobacteria bacterium]|nr:M20/M25/M40 family metallo-hydrolase [Alphaproteobacteria bacterium]